MTLVRRNFLRLACGAIAGSVVAPDVRAQSYPARPIRLVVSVAAGGTNDVTARMIAQKLTEAWGQQVFVDNVPGGGEIVGTGAGREGRAERLHRRCSQLAPSPSTRACTASCPTTR